MRGRGENHVQYVFSRKLIYTWGPVGLHGRAVHDTYLRNLTFYGGVSAEGSVEPNAASGDIPFAAFLISPFDFPVLLPGVFQS